MNTIARCLGRRWAFSLALLWCIFGHQLKIWDAVTTAIGLLVVFVIQHTENIHDQAIHLKLDEIIRAIGEADNKFRCIEEKGEEEIRKLREKSEVD